MCKLVDDERESEPLWGEIMPLVAKRAEEISDPDAREMAEKTYATIKKLHSVGAKPELNVRDLVGKYGDMMKVPGTCWDYLQRNAYQMSKANNEDLEAWKCLLGPWVNEAACTKIMAEAASAGKRDEIEFVDEDESPDLYKGSFSLAYGTLTLLRDTKLHLKKNKFYGLLGPNNCGKTTLMRAVAHEKVEGFPKRDELVRLFCGGGGRGYGNFRLEVEILVHCDEKIRVPPPDCP